MPLVTTSIGAYPKPPYVPRMAGPVPSGMYG